MKLAIVSTTIHDEKGYLKFDLLAAKSKFSEVVFVISGDKKSAPFDSKKFTCQVEFLSVAEQARYLCSEPIGWNKIMRRNIALLRAIELNPDFILMIDDDNIPADDYFDSWYNILSLKEERSVVLPLAEKNVEGAVWYNYLASCNAPIRIYPRGYPIKFRDLKNETVRELRNISIDKIGLFQGISLGDPDVDSMSRIIFPGQISEVKEKNFCLSNVWSPYNTQNTMFSKKLFPVAFVWPYCGRYDDIYSSFVWQKLLFNNNMLAHVGDAVNWQERGQRENLRDLANEVEGYLHSNSVWSSINQIAETDSIKFIEKLTLIQDNEIILRQRNFLLAFLEDLKKIL